jgi:hypothetical protein
MKKDRHFVEFAEGFLQECLDHGLDQETSVEMFLKVASVMDEEMVKSAMKSPGAIGKAFSAIGSDIVSGAKKLYGVEQAAQGAIGKGVKGFGKWHMPSKTPMPGGGNAYTGKDLGLSAAKIGLTGGAGYAGYNYGVDPALRAMFPGWYSRGQYSGGVPGDAYLGGVGSGGGYSSGGGAHDPNLPGYQSSGSSPYSDAHSFLPGGASTGTNNATATGGGGIPKTVFEQQAASRNSRLTDLAKQIREKQSAIQALDASGASTDPFKMEQRRNLEKELSSLRETSVKGEKELADLAPQLQKQEARRDKDLYDRLQRSGDYVNTATGRQQAMMEALNAEQRGDWTSNWWRTPLNRMRGYSIDAAKNQHLEMEKARRERNQLLNAHPNYYFPG